MPRVRASASNFAHCLKIKEAAEFLGVSTATLRNWDRSGKLKPRRHPQNSYRIYLYEELQSLLQTAELSASPAVHDDCALDWSKIGESEHIVQFYEEDDFLLKSVSGFLEFALVNGGCGIVVATAEHRREIERRLLDAGVDIEQATTEGRYLSRDAGELLSTFIVNGTFDLARFHEMRRNVFGQIRLDCGPVRAFGEMVAILWEQGNRDAAIALEQLWNELCPQDRFAVLCAYPIRDFDNDEMESLDGVCACHTRVIPGDSFAKIATENQRMRSVAQLQKQARSLLAEIEHRRAVQKELAKREGELLSAQQSLVEALRRKDELLANLSYELRLPLTPIHNAIEVLDSSPSDADTRNNATDVIRRQVNQVARLVDELMVNSQIAGPPLSE